MRPILRATAAVALALIAACARSPETVVTEEPAQPEEIGIPGTVVLTDAQPDPSTLPGAEWAGDYVMALDWVKDLPPELAGKEAKYRLHADGRFDSFTVDGERHDRDGAGTWRVAGGRIEMHYVRLGGVVVDEYVVGEVTRTSLRLRSPRGEAVFLRE